MRDVGRAQAFLHLVAVQRNAQRHRQVVLAKRLHDVAELRIDLRALQGLPVGMRRGEDHRRLQALVDLLGRLYAAHGAFQAYVHQHQVWL